jgi:chromosome partitioning protein
MRKIAFFNNKGGVGKTSLVYHLSWMFSDRGISTLAIDLDPQANLTSMFLDENRLVDLWDGKEGETVFSCVRPLMTRTGDVASPHVERIAKNLGLIAGDLALSRFEDLLSENWPKALDRDEAAFRILTSFDRIITRGASQIGAEIVLLDVGPNLGAINRTAMLAADEIVIPLGPDLFARMA